MASNEIRYEILNTIGVVGVSKSGWQKELNRISWNGKPPKYDLREWNPDHTRMGKGVTLTEEELRALGQLVTQEVAFLDQE